MGIHRYMRRLEGPRNVSGKKRKARPLSHRPESSDQKHHRYDGYCQKQEGEPDWQRADLVVKAVHVGTVPEELHVAPSLSAHSYQVLIGLRNLACS